MPRGGRGEKHTIAQIAVFPIIFISDCRPGNPKIKTLTEKIMPFYRLIKEQSPAYLFQLIRNSASCNDFKRVILKFTRPEPNQVFNVDNSEGLKFLTSIRLGLSHLGDHKFRHNFQVLFVIPVCSCGQEIETSTHLLLHCSNYHSAR